jgi:hypothetical protein
MGGQDKVRSDERYFADIRAVLKRFYRPGDSLQLVRRFSESRKCQMCGDKVDIHSCFELRNARTGKAIICGRNCIVKYAVVVEAMNETPRIIFPAKYRREAEKINKLRPATVTVESKADYGFYEPPMEGGWDLCNCHVGTSYCPSCDNECCAECNRGCTCRGGREAYYYDPEE